MRNVWQGTIMEDLNKEQRIELIYNTLIGDIQRQLQPLKELFIKKEQYEGARAVELIQQNNKRANGKSK